MRGHQDIAACYRILDLSPGATLAEVKQAYRDLVFVWHPDRYPEDNPRLKQKAEEKLKQINEAYECLQQHLNRPVSPPPPTPSRRSPSRPHPQPHSQSRQRRSPTLQDLAQAGDETAIATLINEELQRWNWRVQVQQQQGLLKVMLNAEQTPRALITTALIHTILQKLQLRCLHTVKIYGLRAQHQVLWSKTFPAPGQEIVPQSISRFAYDRFEINLLALPCAFTLAGLLQFTGLIHLLEFPFLFWMHFMGELGILLLGSRLILLPQLMGSAPPAPSLILYPLVFALLAFLFFNSRRENLRWSMGLAVGLIGLQGLFTFGLSDSAFAVWAGLGGLCGEFLLSTLILINFYHRFPDHLRWDFWRYPFLLLAACGFWQNLKLWWGTFPGTPASELMGTWSVLDLEWLMAQLQWSFSDILQFCQGVFLICSLLVLGFYVYFVLKTEPDRRYALQQQLISWWIQRQARQQRKT